MHNDTTNHAADIDKPTYHTLSRIPNSIAESRKELKPGTRSYALLLQIELIIRFLLSLGWRSRTISECRCASAQPNIFKTRPGRTIPAGSNPDGEEMWQFRFGAHESKTGIGRTGLIPAAVVPQLEEFLMHGRPILVGEQDPGTLFVGPGGKPFSQAGLAYLIGRVTKRHCGVRVGAHHFRRAFACEWLAHHPGDELALARLLWLRPELLAKLWRRG